MKNSALTPLALRLNPDAIPSLERRPCPCGATNPVHSSAVHDADCAYASALADLARTQAELAEARGDAERHREAIGRDTRGGPRWSVSGDAAHLVWGDGVILRARRQGRAWRVDWFGTYRTLAGAAAARGFPPVGDPIDEEGGK